MTKDNPQRPRRDFAAEGLVKPASELLPPAAPPPAAIAEDAAEPPAPAKKPPEPIPMELEVLYRGRRVTLRPTIPLGLLPKFCDRLDELGAFEPPRPPEFDAEGNPICGKHHISMKLREHQGDRWHSHKVVDPETGQELYCKGRPGKDSPGYET